METKISSLYNIYKDYFSIGTAVDCNQIELHKDFIVNHFNSLTPENQLKFINTQPQEGIFTLDSMDTFIKFTEDNNLLARGHTLVWSNQTPDWIFEDMKGKKASRSLLLKRMESHIKYIVSKYQNKIFCWDVVNEAIDDNDDIFYRENKWYSIIGDDYVDAAFQFAHEADPNALLFYNDYNDVMPTKRLKIYKLLKGMIERNVPIHGVGLQGHYNLAYPDISEIKKTIEMFAGLGLTIQITEMDMSVFSWENRRNDLKKPTIEMLNKQAERYGKIFEIFRDYKDVISGVTFWGISDKYTWLDDFPVKGRKDWPLLFNENMLPKQAFKAITTFNT